MTFYGLHWIDAGIIIIYIAAVLVLGQVLSRRVKTEGDFFLAGRSLGRWLQFFLNFGNMTDPSAAATTAASVYQQGAGGVWLGLTPLFMTPYYWFMNVWFRRVRLTTIADLFEDRFGHRFLATLYATINVFVAIVTIGFGNIVALKTLQPIMVKPDSAWSPQERQMVFEYREFVELREQRRETALTFDKLERYNILKGLSSRGELRSYVTALDAFTFYLVSSALVGIFIALGGLKASAVIDALQAALVIGISAMLIPFGLAQIGGFRGLHEKVPDFMFNIFGADHTGEYTWYSIGAFLLMSLVGITAAPGNMNIGGSARDETAARLGAISGGFGKRLVTIAWCFCGLIAAALFGPNLADPDQTWGLLTRALLPVGLIGLMIIGILGGKLAHLGASSIILSALVVKNLYEPLLPGRSVRHYMVVARLTVPVVLLLGIGVALYLKSAIALLKFLIALQVTWGAPILLIFIWRRLTETAVRVQVLSCLLFIGIIPWVVSATPALRRSASLLLMTNAKTVVVNMPANPADVAAGRANALGQVIAKPRSIEPTSVFFEEGIALVDAKRPSSPREGVGRFNIEIYLLATLGVPVADFTPPVLLTARYLVDTFVPLILLICFSFASAPTDPARVDRFFRRMKTPVEIESVDVHTVISRDHQNVKLFPGSNWEFTRWDRMDAMGFAACCIFVGVILIAFKVLLEFGRNT